MVKESSNTKKIVILVLFILVLCLLGLATLSKSYATMKDVEPQFTGGVPTSVTSVSGWWGTAANPATNVYLVPVGDGYNVAWSAYADYLGYATKTDSAYFAAGCPTAVVSPSIAVSYTMQVA